MVRTAVLVSGGGTNLQAILDAWQLDKLPGFCPAAVISSNPDAYALTRAERAGVSAYTLPWSRDIGRHRLSELLLHKLSELEIELVVLAGFMHILSGEIIDRYKNRIINIHPALIPAFSGEGCYGIRVHQMALDYGVKLSGATAHFVTADADAGPVILQQAVQVLEDDTPETLQKRIMQEAEQIILPEAIRLYCAGRLRVCGRVVRIENQ